MRKSYTKWPIYARPLIVLVVSSRLAVDARGRLTVVVTASSDAGLVVGETFRVLGNDLPVNEAGFGWLGARAGVPVAKQAPSMPRGARLPQA
jgi:hypothetical protein